MKKLYLPCFVVFALTNWQCRKSDTIDQQAGGKPNIIFLLADDLRHDALGYTGNSLAITPNLDALAAQGTHFRNAYVTSAICATSRASILTGQYARRHGIDDFERSLPAPAQRLTYPSLLRYHGYYTGFIGKYGVGRNLPSASFDYWKGYSGHGNYFVKDASGRLVHETAMMGQQAREFLKNRNRSKPFCLNISFKAPHSEDGVNENNGFRWDPYFDNWFQGVDFPRPVTYDNSYYSQFPSAWRKNGMNRENEGRVRWSQRFTDQKFQTSCRAIYRLVSGLDKVIGELRDELAAQGLHKNTILVFTSDNGYYMGEHGLEGKWFGHEESIRVPLIIYDPRVAQQQKIVEELVLNIDLAPTILTWAHVDVPSQVQGKSLKPLLDGSPASWRKEFFYEHLYESGAIYIPKTVGVVTPSWKYMRYYNGSSSYKGAIFEELFDVKADPLEQKNRAGKPEEKNRIETFKKKVVHYEQHLR